MIKFLRISILFWPLLTVLPLSAAEPSVQFEVIARSGETPVPAGVGNFTGFGSPPAIDDEGNVVFLSGGPEEVGIYTHINGVCCQRVVNNYTLIPGGGGAKFSGFNLEDTYDIDGGRVAFQLTDGYLTVYSNVGQSSPNDLIEVAAIDGGEWSVGGNPWVDGDNVAMWGRRLIPSDHYTTQIWDGTDLSESFIDPGAGYVFGGTQASISGDAVIFARYNPTSDSAELVVSDGSYYEPLLVLDSTPVPGMNNVVFTTFYAYPQIDRNGLDAAFLGLGSKKQILVKRVNGGALQNVVDTTTVLPGSGGDVAGSILDNGYSLADGQMVFYAHGQYWLEGLYTDIGGGLSVLVDNESNNAIELDGVAEQITHFYVSPNSLAKTPQGYMVVFKADLQSGGSAIVKATIVEGSVSDYFTVYKAFSDGNSSSVSVNLTCSSGTVINNPQWASAASPALFEIENALQGTTCTAVESVPPGYTANQSDCQNGDPLNSSCTIVNIANTGTFTVYKNFSDNNSESVSFSLNCTSGTVTNNPQFASEASPASFDVKGFHSGSMCTAIENNVPPGYSANQSDCQKGDPINGSCTIINNLELTDGSFTVYKNFSDDSNKNVSVTLSCSSGTVSNNPQNASEASPAVFAIRDHAPGATCTADENNLTGAYTVNQSDCQNGDPVNSSCTIVNTKGGASFTVSKDFNDDNPANVSITLSCTSGTVINNPQNASEASPALFFIQRPRSGATCTAIENDVPSGYSSNESDCRDGDAVNSGCTVVNLSNVSSFTVFKDFSDDNPNSVEVSLSCSSGMVTNNPQNASEASPAVFSISGAASDTTCTANENSIPSGYSENQSDCQDGDLINGNCTIVNTLRSDSFTVFKDFSDDNPASVGISLACSSGTVTNSPQWASESSPAVFDIRGAAAGASCAASESNTPSGYIANESDCQNGDSLNGSCTIVNVPNTGSFRVFKDFSDNNPASVSISLSCSSGTVINNPQLASELSPALFNIEAAALGATCTATENSRPSGYTINEFECQKGDPVNGDCTLVNIAVPPQPEGLIFRDGFDIGGASNKVR